MYITFYQTKYHPLTTITFEDLLKNPYQDLPEGYIPTECVKVTYNIKEETAKRYFEKHVNELLLKNTLDASPPLPVEDIPQYYRHFQIPKKTNPKKKRDIDTPTGTILAQYQYELKNCIENTLRVLAHDAAHGYVRMRSTVTERQVHLKHGSKWFLYLDLKDFFPSHNKKYCMKILEHIYPFGVMLKDNDYKTGVEKIIDYALLNNSLPQGTPLSPTLTNVLMVPIDTDISNTLRDFDKKNFKYTRYADDITISCKQKFDPQKIINEIEKILNKWEAPFKINTAKIKFGSTAGKNYHLGTIINKDNKLKLGHKKNQKLRAAIFQYGMKHIVNQEVVNPTELQSLLGNIAYAKAIDPDYINHILKVYSNKFGTDIQQHMIKTLNSPLL